MTLETIERYRKYLKAHGYGDSTIALYIRTIGDLQNHLPLTVQLHWLSLWTNHCFRRRIRSVIQILNQPEQH